jgi:suppressor for copper-sensitivity B
MRGDMTKPDPKIEQYLVSNQKYGIPFNIVYGPLAPNGIILPVLFSFDDLKNAIEKAR